MQLFEVSDASVPGEDIKPGMLVEDADGDVFVVLTNGALLAVRNWDGETLNVRQRSYNYEALARSVTNPVHPSSTEIRRGDLIRL